MLRGMQAKFPQEASTSQLYHLAQGVAPVWTVDAVSDIILLWPKPELHTWSTYLLGAGITGPKVELTGLESFLYRKIPLRG